MYMLNFYAAWIGILLGFVAGVVLGFFFHREDWLGGYHSWRRRMVRLGHISFFGILLYAAAALPPGTDDLDGGAVKNVVQAAGFEITSRSRTPITGSRSWRRIVSATRRRPPWPRPRGGGFSASGSTSPRRRPFSSSSGNSRSRGLRPRRQIGRASCRERV